MYIIREWRQAGGPQSGLLNNGQPVHDSIPSPTVSASRKRQKTSQSIPSLSLGAPSPVLHTQPVTAPSSSAAIRGSSLGSKSKTAKSVCQGYIIFVCDCFHSPFVSLSFPFVSLSFFISWAFSLFYFFLCDPRVTNWQVYQQWSPCRSLLQVQVEWARLQTGILLVHLHLQNLPELQDIIHL